MKTMLKLSVVLFCCFACSIAYAKPKVIHPIKTIPVGGTCPDGMVCVDTEGSITNSSTDCPSGNCVEGDLSVDGQVTILGALSADTISTTQTVDSVGVEYVVWSIKDLNGDVVAAQTVECSVLTDGGQVCVIHNYVMNDTPGTLSAATADSDGMD